MKERYYVIQVWRDRSQEWITLSFRFESLKAAQDTLTSFQLSPPEKLRIMRATVSVEYEQVEY